MRGACLNHKFVYGSAMQTERLITQIADKHQRATQSYVRRPYGIGLLVAGYDRTGAHLFQTDPSGNYYEWKAMAIGSRSQSAKTYLERNFEKFTDCKFHAFCLRALMQCLQRSNRRFEFAPLCSIARRAHPRGCQGSARLLRA